MTTWRSWTLTMAAVLVARACDVVFTVLIAPRLETESNPFVTALGFDWATLLVSNAVVLILVGAALAWALRQRVAMGPPPGRMGATEHHVRLLYGRNVKGWDLVWVAPPAPRVLYFLAMMMPYAVLFASAGATAHNILGATNAHYANATAPFFVGAIPYFTLVLGLASTVAATAVWFMGEHRRHQQGRLALDTWEEPSTMPGSR